MDMNLKIYEKMLITFREELTKNSNDTYNTLTCACDLIISITNNKFDRIITIEDNYKAKNITKSVAKNEITLIMNELDYIYHDLEKIATYKNYSENYTKLIDLAKQEVLDVKSDSCMILNRVSDSKKK